MDLMVGLQVTNDNNFWLLELLSILNGKGTWGPLSLEEVGLGVGGEHEDGSFTILSVVYNENVS